MNSFFTLKTVSLVLNSITGFCDMGFINLQDDVGSWGPPMYHDINWTISENKKIKVMNIYAYLSSVLFLSIKHMYFNCKLNYLSAVHHCSHRKRDDSFDYQIVFFNFSDSSEYTYLNN